MQCEHEESLIIDLDPAKETLPFQPPTPSSQATAPSAPPAPSLSLITEVSYCLTLTPNFSPLVKGYLAAKVPTPVRHTQWPFSLCER